MPDITLRSGENCPLKDSCYRHVAYPEEWQSYFSSAPYNHETKICNYFWALYEKTLQVPEKPVKVSECNKAHKKKKGNKRK